MSVELGSVDHVTQVIGPSFLVGAVASFIAMLFSRMAGIADRLMVLAADLRTSANPERTEMVTLLRARLRLNHLSIMFAMASGIATTILIIWAFSAAFPGLQQLCGAVALFSFALALFCVSLLVPGYDVARSIHEYDLL